MTTPSVTETRRNDNPVGERTELGRYTVAAGQRVLYGQRVDGSVRFLPDRPVVVDNAPASSEDSNGRRRKQPDDEGRSNAARQKRPNGDGELTGGATSRRARTGVRVELARYSVSAGERVVYGQRVLGVVRFLPREGVVLVAQQGLSEDDACRSRRIPGERARPDAARRKRPKGVSRARLINTGGAS